MSVGVWGVLITSIIFLFEVYIIEIELGEKFSLNVMIFLKISFHPSRNTQTLLNYSNKFLIAAKLTI